MSFQAKLINFIIRRTLRKLFNNIDTTSAGLAAFRASMKKTEKYVRALPKHIQVEKIQCNGVSCEWISDAANDANKRQVLMYLHGGGYVVGGPDSHRDLAWRLAETIGCRLLLVDYRLAPEHPFPAAIDDASNCYRWLLDNGYPATDIALAGDSAGGGLVAASLLKFKTLELPQPRCAALLSPWLDLTASGDSVQTNQYADPMISANSLASMAQLYLGQADASQPLASPIFGDLTYLPPVLVHVGSTELLLSDAERFAQALEQQGGEAIIKIWAEVPHVFQMFAAFMPEAKQSIKEIGEFIAAQLDTPCRTNDSQ